MDHKANLGMAVARCFTVLGCESTVAEMAPHLSQDDMGILRDIETWARDLRMARKITPAREWASPTQLRKEVAARTGASREFVGRKPAAHFPKRRRG